MDAQYNSKIMDTLGEANYARWTVFEHVLSSKERLIHNWSTKGRLILGALKGDYYLEH